MLDCGEHEMHEDGFVCDCNDGYTLQSDGKTCIGGPNLHTTFLWVNYIYPTQILMSVKLVVSTCLLPVKIP